MSEYRKVSTLHVFADNVETNTTGLMMEVADFMNVIVAITGEDATVKFQGSLQDSSDGIGAPDFSVTPTADNQWDFIQVIDYEDNARLDGDTGVVLTASDTRIVEFNTNGLSWVNIQISGNTGTVTARAKGYATN